MEVDHKKNNSVPPSTPSWNGYLQEVKLLWLETLSTLETMTKSCGRCSTTFSPVFSTQVSERKNHGVCTLISLVMAESPTPPEPESRFNRFNFRKPNLDVFAGTHVQPEVRDWDFRDECARRDDYRCCVTRHLDTRKWKHDGYLPENEPHGNVECADIIPCSYTSWVASEVFP
jgi:hypothetical protein